MKIVLINIGKYSIGVADANSYKYEWEQENENWEVIRGAISCIGNWNGKGKIISIIKRFSIESIAHFILCMNVEFVFCLRVCCAVPKPHFQCGARFICISNGKFQFTIIIIWPIAFQSTIGVFLCGNFRNTNLDRLTFRHFCSSFPNDKQKCFIFLFLSVNSLLIVNSFGNCFSLIYKYLVSH